MATSNPKLGYGSIYRVDPEGGSSYVQIVNQLSGSFNRELSISEVTTKSSGQWAEFIAALRSWGGTLNGYNTTQPLLDLNGTDEYAFVADHNDFDFSTDVTLQVTIVPGSVSGTQYLIHKTDGADGYALYLNNDEVSFLIDNSGATDSTTTTNAANLVAGTTYTIKVVYDGGTTTTKVYINGVDTAATVTGTVPATCGINATRVTIGADSANANLYDGEIGSAGLSSAGTLDAQFLQPNAAGTVAYYLFNGDLTDETSNSHDLTGTNIAAADYGDLTLWTLHEAYVNAASLTLQFYVDETTTPETWTGSVNITGLTKGYPNTEASTYDISFAGTSTLTVAN